MSVDDSDYKTLHRKWRAACEAAQAERDTNVDLRAQLAALDTAYAALLSQADARIAELEENRKTLVIVHQDREELRRRARVDTTNKLILQVQVQQQFELLCALRTLIEFDEDAANMTSAAGQRLRAYFAALEKDAEP